MIPWIKKRVELARFSMWVKEENEAMKDSPMLAYFFHIKVKTRYIPLFKKEGFQAVLDEHEHFTDDIRESLKS